MVDLGKEGKRKEVNDAEIIDEIIKRYEMDQDKRIIFTDGSKRNENTSTEAAMVEEGEEERNFISINKRCLIYTVEATAIAKAIQKWVNKENQNNLAIFSDSRSVLQRVKDNTVDESKNPYVTEIRRKEESESN